MSFAGGSFARSSRARRFISRHLTLWLMLWILGTVVLTSVLAGARDERKRSTAGLGQQRRSQSVVNVLNEKGGLQLKGNRNSDVRVGDRQRLVAELFMNPPASLPAAMLTVTSSATLRATPNNGNAEGNPGGIQEGSLQGNEQTVPARGDNVSLKPKEERLIKAHSFNGDLRDLPRRKPVKRERPELEGPEPNPTFYPSTPPTSVTTPSAGPRVPDLNAPAPAVPAPPPGIVFEGLDRENWGAGSPPDTNGDVGPTYYIQSVNTSVGIYRKSDGFREAAFTFDTLMSQGNFGNLCDTDNFGDPVVLYDTFDDRWILTDFAFLTDVGGNVLSPAYQCFAVSMNGNPLTGGWNFYSIPVADHLNDYPKLGVWTDGLYMSANLFSFGAGSSFQGVRVWAFNKAQMYAGSPTVKIVSFNLATGDFTVVPANARLQTGTPPPGRPNFFLSTWLFTNAVTVYKFHVDWNSTSLSTFTGPDVPIAATSWPNAAVANAPQPGTATLLDVLQIRAMVQSQYTNFGGTESLWVPHTVRRANTTGFAAPRWYQTNITGGTVALSLPQAATWDPDAANVIHRYMPSLALDRGGNMAMGYSTSNSTTEFPSLKYAGRLSTDPINTFGQTEQTLFSGTASQTGTSRWGDYSSMMLDPDGCTFWYTNEYANPVSQAFNMRWLTKIGSFKFAECTPVGAGGTVSGTVTDTATSNPINGATVALGGRTETTDISGAYTFLAIPAGTYPSITASFAGYGSSTATSIVVADAATTTQNFSLTAAPTAACLTDTTQADFLLGVFTGVDLNTSPGEVTLINLAIDQQNTAGTTTGTGFGTPAWTGQTFTSAVNGQLVAADIQLFCNGCGATPPNLTLSVRNTAAGLPTGVDLASVTIPGSAFASGASVTFTASFGSPATLTSGTQYALILRPVSVPTGSGYFWIRSSPSTYASGSRVLSADSGGTWSADTTRDYNFKTYMRGPYSPTSGNLVSNTRDANPSPGLTPIWSTLSWNASTPASTSLQFQLAGSNSVNGPFNFIGPDGTAATFFTTSPASLNQFYGLRYLQYKAFLSTTNSAVTPTLSDATICFADVDCSGTTPTITPAPAQVCENSTGNTASGPAGMTAYSWSITNGTITSSTTLQSVTYTAGASGNVMLTLTITTPSSCITANSLMVPINAIPAIPTITPGGPTTFCAGDSVTLTSSSASGNQWYLNGNPIGGATNQTYVATASGDYTNTVTTSGCTSAPSIATTVTVNPIPATPTITPGGPTTFCEGGSVTLTSSSASGNQWYLNGNPIGGATNQSYVATASGDYTNTVTTTGCTSTPSIATTVTVNPIPATPTITPGGPTTFCTGGSVTLTSSSASGNQWYLNGNPIGGATNQTYVATASGDYTNTVTTSGCTSAPSIATTVTVNPIPATPTITPGGPTTFCAGGSVTLTSSSASGNQWYLNGNPIGGATNQTYVATASGDYTNTVTTSGCTSAPSIATTVTVNAIPPTPTITPGGPTTFCAGGSVTLTSSSASGNQWYLNGNPIGGATNQTYIATASGDYTNIVTTSGCSSASSAPTTVTVSAPSPVVTNTNDSGAGSLRQAIIDACDGGTITFDPGLSGQTITLTTGELVVNKSLTIQGLGANLLTVSGNNVSRVVNVTVAGPGIVTISGLTVANGAVSSADGGGIRNSSSGTINVSGSTVSNNSAVNGVGAGIVNLVSGTVNVISSTLSGNANADGGGGIYNDGTVNVINSTLSGNSASIGGGILNTGTVTVIDSTISDNSAINFGGGIFRTGGTVTLHNTIVAGNEQGVSNVPSDIGGPVDATSSFNLIGTGGSGGLINGVNNNQVGVADARLGPLANNGGSTLTHALLSGSAALDTGSNALLPADTFDLDGDSNTAEPLPVDQRGAGSPRVQDAADADTTQTVDIGAFEARASAEDITDQSTLEDTPLSFGFNVGDVSMITSVTASSSNATLVPNLAANLSITGSGSSRTLNITPALNENTTASGTSTVTVMVTSGTESMTDTFVLTVTAVNDAPTFQIASNPPTITEDSGPQIVPGFATNFQPGPVTATDESGQTLVGYTVTLTGTSGSLSFAVNPNINNAGNLSYSVAADSSGTATFDVVATDTGSGTPPNVNQSAPVSFTITVDGVNDGPVNTNPGPQSVVENSTLTFSAANSNQISVSDTDVGTNPMQVTLTASDGTMTLASVAGLLFSVGDGTNDSTMTFGGMLPALNNALNGLTFHPTNGFNGVASLQILSNDQGFTGTGGAHSDNDVVNINVLDGGTLAFSSAAYMVSESGPVATITVNRSGGTNGEARIDYATSNGTATAGGTDYTTATGTLIFANGVTTQTFTVPINNDAIDEPDETVNLTLSNPQGSGALGSPSTAVLTITDDDATPSISIDDPAITEGNSGTVNLVFTVTLSGPSSQAVTVNYATGNNTATAPSDFVGIPSTLLTFNPLETSKQITVVVNGDNDFEPNEALEINLSSPSNATLADPQGLGFINNDDPPGGTFVFNSPTYFTTETLGSITITVNRTGTTTQAASVDYATSDMTASERSDYTTALGTLNFPIGATSATFKVLVNIDSFAEISEVVGLTLSNPSFGAALGTPSSATLLIDNIPNAALNTNDDPGAFVDQHYHDFLNREADGLGRQFWINQITGCGVDATCIEIKRINVSAAFFLSIEFQETGFTAFLTHRAAFGSVLPGYRPFERDTQALQRGFAFGLPGADVILEANKVAYFNEFVVRPEFITIYGSLTNAQYVDALIANTAVTFTTPERDALVNGLDSATETRATVLRTITEKGSFKQAQFNRAFVYMQYVGYLRRAPADPPDNNLDGFNFWLNKLNQFNGNFVDAEMVKAFILSTEYRQRFGL